MAINKVEYINNSSKEGFALAGEEVTIRKSNAQTIKDDVTAGNTENLSKVQRNYLNNALKQADNTPSDTTTYDTESNESAELPEEGTETTENTEVAKTGAEATSTNNNKKSKDGGTSEGVGTMLAAGTAIVGAGVGVSVGGALGSGVMFGPAAQASATAAEPAMMPLTAPVIGGIALGLATAAVASVVTFDSEYKSKLAELGNAAEYLDTLSQYTEALKSDVVAYSTEGQEAEEQVTQTPETEKAPEEVQPAIEELQVALEEAEAAGDTEKAEEIKKQIALLQKGAPTGENGEKITPDMIIANNEEAHSIRDFILEPTMKLHRGKMMGQIGTINTIALAACTAVTTFLAIKAWKGVTPWTLPPATIGAALCTGAAAVFLGASVAMGVKTANEFKCGSKGDELLNSIRSFNQPLQEHDNITSMLGEEKAEEESGEENTTIDELIGEETPKETANDSTAKVNEEEPTPTTSTPTAA